MVTEIAKEQGAYGAHFRRLRERIGTETPPWLARLREDAFGSFERLGFPTVGQEEWKYTNVAAVAKANFEPAAAGAAELDADALRPFTYEEARASRLVFVNGFYSPELSSAGALPEGVVATDLAAALGEERHAETLRRRLARGADFGEHAFTALNTAFLEGGAFVLIPKGVRVDAPLHLLFLSDGPVASSPRVLVVAERDSSATVIESYAAAREGGGAYLTNAVAEVWLEEGARLEHYRVQREGADAFHVATTRAALARASSFDLTTVTLGARLSRHDVEVTLDGEGAECWVDGLYLVGGEQHTDTHSVIDHRLPHCTSHQLYKGILDGRSRAVFNGKVFVREGAQRTDAQQTNRNLLLSDEARVDTKPQLEIFADDVKCAHGATVGQLEEEELFYLASRGLGAELARNLLTYGFAEEVIEKIKVLSIRAQLDEAVLNRLHSNLGTGSL